MEGEGREREGRKEGRKEEERCYGRLKEESTQMISAPF